MQGGFRLLPSERVIWRGTPERDAPRDAGWVVASAIAAAVSLTSALFGALVHHVGQPGGGQLGWMAVYFFALALALWLAPGVLHGPTEYAVTDRRVLWRRGPLQRWIDIQSISYARIHWSRSRADLGHLELVCATPYGPLLRKQRLWLRNLRAPDARLAELDGVEPSPYCGDSQLPLIERLSPGERVLWGDHPHGALLSLRNVATAALGAGLLLLTLAQGAHAWGALLDLELRGLQVQSWTWLLLFSAMALSWGLMLAIASGLVWHGLWRARSLGHATEYVVTDRRVVIRRGRTELYLPRRHIVDVAVVPVALGTHHLFLILDAPGGRALADHGALTPLPPARDQVAPVMYELSEPDAVRELLLHPDPAPQLDDAA